ncbi:MAG: tRNA preQ1(34) S-adenosylmethionine ribosyltransferase-isomerase QueA [Cephaloticoccus sp.]|nr:tRNA preQ1(34) S-adenosylmethionine ribosyltransferase-isomerase QueA [Cephaloticoccus sp.]MCF7759173.1 tRNA preQ1(34) S-adenosylmethionine ribosyltransferase-isomerase QueA [Cephaloticoccus sp.]
MPPLATHLFDYHLPERLIAQTPATRRDASQLLVVNRALHSVSHHVFTDLPDFLSPGDTLIRNNASVLPARLRAVRPSGGQVECFLLRPVEGETVWRCLIKPGKRLPVGATFAHETGEFTGEILAKESDGSALVKLDTRNQEPITAVANRLGSVPLPPYIRRSDETLRATDLARYQTVYANPSRQVAVAAPTAGLHFTPELLSKLSTQGVTTAEVTLHVGLGTFRPITTDTVDAHDIHRELYEMPAKTQLCLGRPNGRRIAVGTTTVRTIEHFLRQPSPTPGKEYFDEADIYIYPPSLFQGVDALITNFHQPRSTLLCLVSAFITPGSTEGITWLKEIYAEAITREYRFFSYGDAMLIL